MYEIFNNKKFYFLRKLCFSYLENFSYEKYFQSYQICDSLSLLKGNIKITRWLYQGAHFKTKIYQFTYLKKFLYTGMLGTNVHKMVFIAGNFSNRSQIP